MELGQRTELRQKVTLSPQVYQGLSILAMPIFELQQLVEAEMLENPLLEVDEIDPEPDEVDEARQESAEEERAWDEWLDMYDELDSAEYSGPRDPNEEAANTEEFVGGSVSFSDYLEQQLAMMDLSDEVDAAARAVIGSLDADGFFKGDCSEVAALVGVTTEHAEEGLRVVQQLDPPGVGARSLTEALVLQMDFLGLEDPLLEAIITDHLDDVAANHFRKIARALKATEPEVREAVAALRSLNPRPAGAYSPGPSPGYIVPDVTIRRFDDEWLIIPNSESVPTLRVSPRYRSMLRSGSNADEDTRRYLKEKIRSAESFIKNVDRRKDTVSRITGIILEVQSEFFEDGKGPLRPLRLEDVAVELGVHLSTVSRGVTGKYMATPYGLFELKHFFAGGYRTSTGMDIASTSIKQRLKELVAEEDAVKPLSDQKLAELLSAEGVSVARRTVAKYREELHIEPSWARRRR
ncbi:MAG: RNA polymerase factor sigma-54 [Anaerosomatales bacterium]|nr:RNA polymerase factor sigma-54 [Anaerosomatales bacterium]MDT8434552.1 RNA polymerase factor sigma-54 [Anaerosomatales bacterium]